MRWCEDGWHRWVECECGEVVPREFFRMAWANYQEIFAQDIRPEGIEEEMALEDVAKVCLDRSVETAEALGRGARLGRQGFG